MKCEKITKNDVDRYLSVYMWDRIKFSIAIYCLYKFFEIVYGFIF